MTTIFLEDEEAKIFLEFQKRFNVIASIVGTLDTFNTLDLKNSSLTLDFDNNGIIAHSSITKHYRR